MVNFEVASTSSFRDIKKNHFKTEAVANIDDSIAYANVSHKNGDDFHFNCRKQNSFCFQTTCSLFLRKRIKGRLNSLAGVSEYALLIASKIKVHTARAIQ